MARIQLYFDAAELVSEKHGSIPLVVIRLVTHAKFRLDDGGFTQAHWAIVDTGAHTSVLPRHIWQSLEREVHTDSAKLGGINNRPECQIPALIASITCHLTDRGGNRTADTKIPAFLAKSDHVPIILGFASLLERFGTYFHYPTGEAWIEQS